uniref:CAAX prenyl protease n=1 Tax=Aceria tosichella TaxID=561515 RepID=A0A6G1SBR6_9ACAR
MHYYVIGVLTVSWALWLWDTYLDYRQYRVVKKTESVPDILKDQIGDETFKKAKSYSIDKARFGFVTSAYSQIQFTLTICLFLMPYFWQLSHQIMTGTFGLSRSDSIEWEIFQSLVFTFITSIVSTLVNLPVSIYNTFFLEQKHGFNKQTPAFYAWDKLKKFLISFSISAPVLSGVVYIVRKGGDYFFLYLWLFCFVVVLVLTFFHGEIAALFDKFTPLPAGELRDRIEKLAEDVNFPLSNIFVVEGSKRSTHSNAYQSGMFSKKRIVIYDTLIADYYKKKEANEKKQQSDDGTSNKDVTKEKEASGNDKKKGCSDDEIIAVLCHEIGHWYHMHLFKYLMFAETNYLFIFIIFSKLYNDVALYSAFGFYREQPVVIGLALLMMILTPYLEILGFVSTLMSRKNEYQSDAYAMKRGHAEQLKTALVKLNIDNLGFPVHDELYSTFNHSHPTLIQRIKALERSKTD